MSGWVDFAAVKRAVSLETVLRHYQVPGLRRRRNRLQGRCPIHRGEREDSFRVDLDKNVFHCFGCQASGNVLAFVAAMERCSIRGAALRLQYWFSIGVPDLSWAPPSGQLVRKKEGFNPPLRFALTNVDHAHGYLAGRGIDRATASEFGVGFYARPGLMSGRIVIPIHNGRGEIVAYSGRAPDGRVPKYKLPTGFHKSLELFNLHRVLAAGNKTVIVVEGYFDCMRVRQAGFPGVVALMGASLSARQESTLLERFDRVIVLLDGDAAGRAGSRSIAARLSGRCSLVTVELPDGTQPDQLSTTAIQELLKHRTSDSF
jgi:DNA primase